MKNKKILWALLVFLPVYSYLYTYKGEIVVHEGTIDTAYCQKTLKSGTLLKAEYTIDNRVDQLSILPLGTTCEVLLDKLKVDNTVWLRQKIGPFGTPSSTMISIDGGKKYYGSDD